jgi:hypothetical protein
VLSKDIEGAASILLKHQLQWLPWIDIEVRWLPFACEWPTKQTRIDPGARLRRVGGSYRLLKQPRKIERTLQPD